MPASGEIEYTFRVRKPDVLVRGRANNVQMAVYRDRRLVAPTSGIFRLFSPDETELYENPAVTITNRIAVATIPALSLPATLSFGELYLERWLLTFADGIERIGIREAALAFRELYCPVAEIDLTSEYPNIDAELAKGVPLQDWIDEAWAQIVNRMRKIGVLSYTVISSEALRETVRHLAYYFIFKELFRRTTGSTHWRDLYVHHLEMYNRAWGEMNFRTDLDQDGFADSTERRGASLVIHRNVPPFRRRSQFRRW